MEYFEAAPRFVVVLINFDSLAVISVKLVSHIFVLHFATSSAEVICYCKYTRWRFYFESNSCILAASLLIV